MHPENPKPDVVFHCICGIKFDQVGLLWPRVVAAKYPRLFLWPLSTMKQAIDSAIQRPAIEVAASSNDLRRFHSNAGLQANPLQYLDYSKLTLVPAF